MTENGKKRDSAAYSSRYTKKQLICSERYCNQSDLLCALLENGKTYTFAEADEIMIRFKKGKVKVC
ncbi:hypothetical protein RZO55_17495 [Clostridium boliviensis]|uniref:Uncharacterized protein n=1 Tax=Clostridium boliviensis TaxID=318465 RepID=A0ABU4GQV9_9CLOT|nr:hypothetical protein [Clostridium boliviensis]MDW2799372.1 hypothetical protein [Clostridium boliviensis]